MIGSSRWCSIDAGAMPALERGGVDDRLEGRAGLTPRLRRANVAGRRRNRGRRRARALRRTPGSSATRLPSRSRAALRAFAICAMRAPIDFSAAHCISGIVAGVDAQPALQHLLAAEARDELAADFFLVVAGRTTSARGERGRGGRRRAQRHRRSTARYSASVSRPVSRISRSTRLRRASARFGRRSASSRVGDRTMPASSAASCGSQIRRRLPEVAARRRLDAVVAVAEVDGVQVGVENLLLGVALLEPDRDRRFANLAREGAIRRQLLEPRELLRQGAAAFDDAAAAPVAPGGLDDARGVEPVMRIEAPILDRQQRVDHVRRHAVERHVDRAARRRTRTPGGSAGRRRSCSADARRSRRASPRGRARPSRATTRAARPTATVQTDRRGQQHAGDQQYSSHHACLTGQRGCQREVLRSVSYGGDVALQTYSMSKLSCGRVAWVGVARYTPAIRTRAYRC